MSTARVFDYEFDLPTTQVPIVHGPTQLDNASAKAGEIASIISSHAKTAAVVAGQTWWQVAKTSPHGFHLTASKTLAWVKDARGAERIDSHYGVLAKFNGDEAIDGKVATKQSNRCEKFEKRHRRRVARRAVTVAVPNLAFVGANAYAHFQFPVISETAIALAEVGLLSTAYGIVGNSGAIEVVKRVTTSKKVTPEKMRKALHDLGISALRKDLEREKPDTDIADFEGDRQRGTITTTVTLVSGVEVRDILSRRRRLAANLRKSESQVILAEGSGAHELLVTIYKDDPSDRIVESWPLANINAVNIFDPIPLGVNASGETITYTFDEAHLFIAGQSRWGKSVTMRTLAATVALDPRVSIWVWNGTQAATFAFLEPIAEVYANGNAAKDQGMRDKGARIIDLLNDESDKRGKILESLGRDKVDNDCAHVDGLNPIVVFMDELAPLFANDNGSTLREAENLANQCLKYGIYLICATQTFDRNAVPWSFVGLFQKKIGHKLAAASDNQALFGNQYAQRGIDACEIRVKGEAILDGETDTHQTLRVYMADEQSRNEAVARGLKARGGEVQRISLEVLQTPDPAPAEVDESAIVFLNDILSVKREGETGAWTQELVDRLAEKYEAYADLDADSLKQRLKSHGITPKAVTKSPKWTGEAKPKGGNGFYFETQIRSTLNQLTGAK